MIRIGFLVRSGSRYADKIDAKPICGLFMVLSLTLVLCLAFCTAALANSDWAGEYVSEAREAGIMPDELDIIDFSEPISRLDFCRVTYELIRVKHGIETGDIDASFSDTDDRTVAVLASNGIVRGKSGDIFDPQGRITRQEAAVVLTRAAEYMGVNDVLPLNSYYKDNSEIAAWAWDAVRRMEALEIMTGTGDGYFSPLGTYTGEQAAAAAMRLLRLDTEPYSFPVSRRGKASEIGDKMKSVMKGISMPDGARITYDDLSFLTVPYHNFEGGISIGHMIVNKELADEVLDIFAELYDIGYPIERMEPVDYYNDLQTEELDSLDNASMGHNNSSSFCYREIAGSTKLSNHALGRAIDLNPKINPWVKDGQFEPANAQQYVDRSGAGLPEIEQKALIRANDQVCKIFEKYGWTWGGSWTTPKDYQHFEKA